MQTITYKLDITPGGVPLTIHISQYDVGLRQYIFQPYTSVGEFTYVSGATVTLEATKPDGYAVIHNCTYNQDGSITYTVQEQLAAKAGSVWSKVVIRNGNDVLGTGAVVWMVDNAGVKDNAIISDSDIPAIQAAASSASLAEAAATSAQAAATQAAGYVDRAAILGGTPLVAATASAMSDHDRVYVYTGSETGYTAGNWYYWNGSEWTSGGIYNSSAVQTDPTLSVSGMAADAEATGDSITYIKDGVYTVDSTDIAIGGIATDGTNTTASNRLRTSVFIPIWTGMKVVFKAGTNCTRIAIREFNASKVVTSYSSWSTDGYSKTFDHDGFLKFMVAKSNDGNLTVANYDANVSIYYPNGLNNFGKMITENSFDISDEFFDRISGTHNHVTYTWDGDKCTISGTASANSYNRVYYVSGTTMPEQIKPGGRYYLVFEHTDPDVYFDMVAYYSGGNTLYRYYESAIIDVPANTIGILFRLYVLKDTTASDVVTKCAILSAPPNEKIDITQLSASGGDFNAIRTPGTYAILSNASFDHSPYPGGMKTGLLKVNKLVIPNNSPVVYQRYEEYDTGNVFERRYTAVNGWGNWIANYNDADEISILFVGNSLTQDGIAYLPYMLKTYYPEVKFRLYIWYNGGFSLAEQYDYFTNNTPCYTFSAAENTGVWSNFNNSKTMQSILSDYKFNIVCMQEYFNYKNTYTESDLTDWNNCRDYIQSHYTGGNGLEFISLFHAPLRASADSVFALTKSGNELILKKTIAEDMIPTGIAIYRAMQTSLDSLGDQSHLSNDGTHAQEGLPCLLQTYTVLCWLFDRLSINKSIYGCPFRITTSIYNSINVPGPNLGTGIITGTDAENLLAQDVAIKAYKEGKQMVTQNLYSAT